MTGLIIRHFKAMTWLYPDRYLTIITLRAGFRDMGAMTGAWDT